MAKNTKISLIALVVLVVSALVFFHPLIFEHRILSAVDTDEPQSFQTQLEDARRDGTFPLWSPYLFCGMPAYGSLMLAGDRTFDVLSWIPDRLSHLANLATGNQHNGWQILYFVAFGFGVYLFLFYRLKNPYAAVLGALAAMYSSSIIAWALIGHSSKIVVLTSLPYILLFLDRLARRFALLDGVLLVFALHLLFYGGHVQIQYYVLLFSGCFGLLAFLRGWRAGLRSVGTFALALVIAFSFHADRQLSVLEYVPVSIRGGSPLVVDTSPGVGYSYATDWSFPPQEAITLLFPSFYGFGKQSFEFEGREVFGLTYWGVQPFVDAAPYMGIVVLALALWGLWKHRREPLVLMLGAVSVVAFLLSFGKHFPALFDLAFHYLPFFNKFRAPSSLLLLVQISGAILAAYGASSLPRPSNAAVIILGILAFLSLAFSSQVKLWYLSVFGPEIHARLAGIYGQAVGQISGLAASQVSFEAILLFGLLALAAFVSRFRFAVPILALLVFLDLWHVSARPMFTASGEKPRAKPPYVNALLRDAEPYRVLEFEGGRPKYTNHLAYWRIENAYGYQGAKPRRFQDMVDAGLMGSPTFWKVANIKYFIFDGIPVRYGNAMPRVFFVGRYEMLDGLPLLNTMREGFDPKEVVYLAEEIDLEPSPPDSSVVRVLSYKPEEVVLGVKSYGVHILYMSDAFHPGWSAWLNGRRTIDDYMPIFRANYHFRALVVPPGEYTILLTFRSAAFETGKQIAFFASAGLLLLLLFVWVKK